MSRKAPTKGYVYIMSNKAMPGLYKVGFTLKDPKLRAIKFDSAGMPYPYIVEFEILLENPYVVEQKVHRELRAVNENREWFRCSFNTCVQSIKKASDGKIFYEWSLEKERQDEELRDKQIEIQKIEQEEKSRREALRIRTEQEIRQKEINNYNRELSIYVDEKCKNFNQIAYTISAVVIFILMASTAKPSFGLLILLTMVAYGIIFIVRASSFSGWKNEYRASNPSKLVGESSINCKSFDNFQSNENVNTVTKKNVHVSEPNCNDIFYVKRDKIPSNNLIKNSVQQQTAHANINQIIVHTSDKKTVASCPSCHQHIHIMPSDVRITCPNCKDKFDILNGKIANNNSKNTAMPQQTAQKTINQAIVPTSDQKKASTCPSCHQHIHIMPSDVRITCQNCKDKFDVLNGKIVKCNPSNNCSPLTGVEDTPRPSGHVQFRDMGKIALFLKKRLLQKRAFFKPIRFRF